MSSAEYSRSNRLTASAGNGSFQSSPGGSSSRLSGSRTSFGPPPNKLDFGLSNFAGDSFDSAGFLGSVLSQREDIAEIDLVNDDLRALQRDLDTALDQVDKMGSAVEMRIDTVKTTNERLSTELTTLVRQQLSQQEAAANTFRKLEVRARANKICNICLGQRLTLALTDSFFSLHEWSMQRRFGRSSETAIQMGARLKHLDEVRGRAARARSLLQYFNEFMYETELTSPLFVDLPRTLAEAAPVIHDLEALTHDLSVQNIGG